MCRRSCPPEYGCCSRPQPQERRRCARAVAVAAWDADRLNPVAGDGNPTMLALLTGRRDELVQQRTRALNRVTGCCPS
jgi:hypothetical protein